MASLPGKDNSNDSIIMAWAKRIKSLVTSKDVEKDIEEEMASRIRIERKNLWLAAHDALVKLENDLRKMKPDVIHYDQEGKEVSAAYSKSQYETRKKLVDKIDKYTK